MAQEDPEVLVGQEVQVAQEAQEDPARPSLPWALEALSAVGKAWVPPGGRRRSHCSWAGGWRTGLSPGLRPGLEWSADWVEAV